jgi:hypothetical protein
MRFRGGILEVTPRYGIESRTQFLFSAQNWIDDVTDLPLSYEFRYSVVGSYSSEDQGILSPYRVIRRKSENSVTSGNFLPSGLVTNNFSIDVVTYVHDIFGAVDWASQLVTVTSVLPILESDALVYVYTDDTYQFDAFNAIISDLSLSFPSMRQTAEQLFQFDVLFMWMSTSLDIIRNFERMNAAVCMGYDEIFCSASFNRFPCSATSGTCSSCLIGFYGVYGDHNSKCFMVGQPAVLDFKFNSLVECHRHEDCNMDGKLMESYCETDTGLCKPIGDQCPLGFNDHGNMEPCSGHGRCTFFSGGRSLELVQYSKYQFGCRSVCICNNFYGGMSCDTLLQPAVANLEFELLVSMLDSLQEGLMRSSKTIDDLETFASLLLQILQTVPFSQFYYSHPSVHTDACVKLNLSLERTTIDLLNAIVSVPISFSYHSNYSSKALLPTMLEVISNIVFKRSVVNSLSSIKPDIYGNNGRIWCRLDVTKSFNELHAVVVRMLQQEVSFSNSRVGPVDNQFPVSSSTSGNRFFVAKVPVQHICYNFRNFEFSPSAFEFYLQTYYPQFSKVVTGSVYFDAVSCLHLNPFDYVGVYGISYAIVPFQRIVNDSQFASSIVDTSAMLFNVAAPTCQSNSTINQSQTILANNRYLLTIPFLITESFLVDSMANKVRFDYYNRTLPHCLTFSQPSILWNPLFSYDCQGCSMISYDNSSVTLECTSSQLLNRLQCDINSLQPVVYGGHVQVDRVDTILQIHNQAPIQGLKHAKWVVLGLSIILFATLIGIINWIIRSNQFFLRLRYGSSNQPERKLLARTETGTVFNWIKSKLQICETFDLQYLSTDESFSETNNIIELAYPFVKLQREKLSANRDTFVYNSPIDENEILTLFSSRNMHGKLKLHFQSDQQQRAQSLSANLSPVEHFSSTEKHCHLEKNRFEQFTISVNFHHCLLLAFKVHSYLCLISPPMCPNDEKFIGVSMRSVLVRKAVNLFLIFFHVGFVGFGVAFIFSIVFNDTGKCELFMSQVDCLRQEILFFGNICKWSESITLKDELFKVDSIQCSTHIPTSWDFYVIIVTVIAIVLGLLRDVVSRTLHYSVAILSATTNNIEQTASTKFGESKSKITTNWTDQLSKLLFTQSLTTVDQEVNDILTLIRGLTQSNRFGMIAFQTLSEQIKLSVSTNSKSNTLSTQWRLAIELGIMLPNGTLRVQWLSPINRVEYFVRRVALRLFDLFVYFHPYRKRRQWLYRFVDEFNLFNEHSTLFHLFKRKWSTKVEHVRRQTAMRMLELQSFTAWANVDNEVYLLRTFVDDHFSSFQKFSFDLMRFLETDIEILGSSRNFYGSLCFVSGTGMVFIGFILYIVRWALYASVNTFLPWVGICLGILVFDGIIIQSLTIFLVFGTGLQTALAQLLVILQSLHKMSLKTCSKHIYERLPGNNSSVIGDNFQFVQLFSPSCRVARMKEIWTTCPNIAPLLQAITDEQEIIFLGVSSAPTNLTSIWHWLRKQEGRLVGNHITKVSKWNTMLHAFSFILIGITQCIRAVIGYLFRSNSIQLTMSLVDLSCIRVVLTIFIGVIAVFSVRINNLILIFSLICLVFGRWVIYSLWKIFKIGSNWVVNGLFAIKRWYDQFSRGNSSQYSLKIGNHQLSTWFVMNIPTDKWIQRRPCSLEVAESINRKIPLKIQTLHGAVPMIPIIEDNANLQWKTWISDDNPKYWNGFMRSKFERHYVSTLLKLLNHNGSAQNGSISTGDILLEIERNHKLLFSSSRLLRFRWSRDPSSSILGSTLRAVSSVLSTDNPSCFQVLEMVQAVLLTDRSEFFCENETIIERMMKMDKIARSVVITGAQCLLIVEGFLTIFQHNLDSETVKDLLGACKVWILEKGFDGLAHRMDTNSINLPNENFMRPHLQFLEQNIPFIDFMVDCFLRIVVETLRSSSATDVSTLSVS